MSRMAIPVCIFDCCKLGIIDCSNCHFNIAYNCSHSNCNVHHSIGFALMELVHHSSITTWNVYVPCSHKKRTYYKTHTFFGTTRQVSTAGADLQEAFMRNNLELGCRT